MDMRESRKLGEELFTWREFPSFRRGINSYLERKFPPRKKSRGVLEGREGREFFSRRKERILGGGII